MLETWDVAPQMTAGDVPGVATLVEDAKRGDSAAFERLTAPLRGELQLHCYRMLGSIHDAEDAVQEAFLRAWRAISRFEERAAFRSWMYRIATNTCLDTLDRSARQEHRVLPDTTGQPYEEFPEPNGALEIAWVEPYPDAALDAVPDVRPGPDARYEAREAVQLAFIAAIQLLPPRQRAALLLRDVLGWSANEVATLLDSSVASVNGALQRARTVIETRLPSRSKRPAPPTAPQRALLERYLQAWERADVDGFARLLKEDVVFTMPPWPNWYRGRESVRRFFAWTARPSGPGQFRLVATAANGQPAFAFYRFRDDAWRAHSLQVLEFDEDLIATMTSFVNPSLFAAFSLPPKFNGVRPR